jgi:DNA helicase-2/ATP-dependent DNA helicase PcrA
VGQAQIAAPAKPVVDDDGVAVVAADGSTLGVDDDDPAGRVDDEDDPLFLRLIQLKRGGLFTPDGDEIQYSHVAIDEAQDRSAIEVKVLVEAVHAPDKVDHRSVTIAGDTAQRLVFDNNFSGWADLLMQTGQPRSCGRSSSATARPPR